MPLEDYMMWLLHAIIHNLMGVGLNRGKEKNP